MFCPECGTQCENDQRFCTNCGTRFGEPAEIYGAADEATEEAPVTEVPATEAPVVEAPVVEAPVVEAPVVEAPVVEAPVAEQPPVQEQPPVFQPPVQPYVQEQPQFAPPPEAGFMPPPPPPPFKKCGVGSWIGRIVVTCLPLLLTYLALFVSGIIWPRSLLPMSSSGTYAPEAKTLAIVILAVIGASVLVQIICLAVWALRKKGDPALRDWAVGFIIVALAVVVAALLFSLGMMLFNDSCPRLFSFLERYVAPVKYIGLLISAL